MNWICEDCGYECSERWLLCPECTTAEDWAEAKSVPAAMLDGSDHV